MKQKRSISFKLMQELKINLSYLGNQVQQLDRLFLNTTMILQRSLIIIIQKWDLENDHT